MAIAVHVTCHESDQSDQSGSVEMGVATGCQASCCADHGRSPGFGDDPQLVKLVEAGINCEDETSV